MVDPKLRQQLVDAVNAHDVATVRTLLLRHPNMACATTGQGEQQIIHLAVMNDDESMVHTLVELGADAHSGIWPHRDSTSARTMASERGLQHLVEAIDAVEAELRASLSCPNVEVSDEQQKLAGLIRAGRNDEAIAMLEADPDLIKQCDREGRTPLHIAAGWANEPMVDWLCDHGANARKEDVRGSTSIEHAVMSVNWRRQGRIDTAQRIMTKLRQRGCDMTLLAAAAMGDLETLQQIPGERIPKLVLEGGAPFNSRGDLLTRAVCFDQCDAVACLLDIGFDVDEPIPLGEESDDPEAISRGGPLWNAAAFGRHAIAEMLLQRGADPNANVYASGWPFDRAYERGDRAMIDLLVRHGGAPTPYTLCKAHDVEAVERLLETIDGQPDAPAILRELLWSAGCCNALPIVNLVLPRFMALPADAREAVADWHGLLSQPMRLDGPSEQIRTKDYSDDDRFEIMRQLLEAMPDVNVTGRFGYTLLHFAAARAGAANRSGAVARSGTQVERLDRFANQLIEADVDLTQRDDLLCSTPLGWACRYGRTEMVKQLLAAGAPVDEPNTPAWAQPKAWAGKMKHSDIEGLLQQGG